MVELNHDYKAKLGERKKLGTGSVKYPVKVVKNGKEIIVDTTYTISPRQEDDLERMIERFTKEKALEHEGKLEEDKSNTEIEI